MSFIFNINKTDEIKSAQIYCLEGHLDKGNILSGDTANITINGKEIKIKINSVVLINKTRVSEYTKKITLSIDKPDCLLKELEGKIMFGIEKSNKLETLNDISETGLEVPVKKRKKAFG